MSVIFVRKKCTVYPHLDHKTLNPKSTSNGLIHRFLTELFFWTEWALFPKKLNLLLAEKIARVKLSDNLGHDILKLYNVLVHVWFGKNILEVVEQLCIRLQQALLEDSRKRHTYIVITSTNYIITWISLP